MVTLVAEAHFWTFRDDVIIKDADLGAFRYQDKNSALKERVYYNDKRRYLEARGGVATPKNSRPARLRDTIKEFEEILARENVVWQEWRSEDTYQLLSSSGHFITIGINRANADIATLTIDKHLHGKLFSDHIGDVAVTKSHIIVSYNECRLTLVHFTKPNNDGRICERLSTLDPRVQTCEIAGPTGRRFERKLSANLTGDMVVVWWQTSGDEVYPWSPLAKDRDRANVLVYGIQGPSLHLLCYCRTEMAPLSVAFSKVEPNVLLTVEQGFSSKGGVKVLSCVYEVDRGTLHRVAVTTIPLEAPLTSYAHNPSEDRLLLACNNGVLALHCESRGMTHVTKAGLIPTSISWLNPGHLVMVSNDRGQIQCFDMALSLVRLQLVMEDPAPLRILDLSEYFRQQQSLHSLCWLPTAAGPKENPDFVTSQQLLLLHYSHGPLVCLSIKLSGSLPISSPYLVAQYIKHRQTDEAVNLLVSLSWDMEGPTAMLCLNTIANHLLRLPITAQRQSQMESALGSFHVPVQPFSCAVEEEFGPAVRALTRRFLFHVLRAGQVEKAYRLALDLKDHDCFLAVHRVSKSRGDIHIATSALQSARDLETSCSESCSSVLCGQSSRSSSCSQLCSQSCSTCFSDSESDTGSQGSDAEGDSAERNKIEVVDTQQVDPTHQVTKRASTVQLAPLTSSSGARVGGGTLSSFSPVGQNFPASRVHPILREPIISSGIPNPQPPMFGSSSHISSSKHPTSASHSAQPTPTSHIINPVPSNPSGHSSSLTQDIHPPSSGHSVLPPSSSTHSVHPLLPSQSVTPTSPIHGGHFTFSSPSSHIVYPASPLHSIHPTQSNPATHSIYPTSPFLSIPPTLSSHNVHPSSPTHDGHPILSNHSSHSSQSSHIIHPRPSVHGDHNIPPVNTAADGTVTISITQPVPRPPQPARQLFFSSDPNEEFVDSETVSVFVDKEGLETQYNKGVYQGVMVCEHRGLRYVIIIEALNIKPFLLLNDQVFRP